MNENPTDAFEQFVLGRKYFTGEGVPKDLEKSVFWLTKAAEQDYAGAQFILGKLHTVGVGVQKDIEKARYWVSKSAKQGNEDAKKLLDSLPPLFSFN